MKETFQHILESWPIVAALIIGIYEVIVRAIPTVGSWSVLGKIIAFIKWISDNLDVRKR